MLTNTNLNNNNKDKELEDYQIKNLRQEINKHKDEYNGLIVKNSALRFKDVISKSKERNPEQSNKIKEKIISKSKDRLNKVNLNNSNNISINQLRINSYNEKDNLKLSKNFSPIKKFNAISKENSSSKIETNSNINANLNVTPIKSSQQIKILHLDSKSAISSEIKNIEKTSMPKIKNYVEFKSMIEFIIEKNSHSEGFSSNYDCQQYSELIEKMNKCVDIFNSNFNKH